MTSILITGSSGRIGTVLRDKRHGLKNVDITEFDLPDCDVRDLRQLMRAFRGQDTVVHLAWNTDAENSRSARCYADNFEATQNVYDAARLVGVRRVIVASSVHAHRFKDGDPDSPPTLHPADLTVPANPYGAHKRFMEDLGSFHASTGTIEVVCIRFGTVCRDGEQPPSDETSVWLSNRDCVSLVQTCVDAPRVPNYYCIVYGVSDNYGRQQFTKNPFDWRPLDRHQAPSQP